MARALKLDLHDRVRTDYIILNKYLQRYLDGDDSVEHLILEQILGFVRAYINKRYKTWDEYQKSDYFSFMIAEFIKLIKRKILTPRPFINKFLFRCIYFSTRRYHEAAASSVWFNAEVMNAKDIRDVVVSIYSSYDNTDSIIEWRQSVLYVRYALWQCRHLFRLDTDYEIAIMEYTLKYRIALGKRPPISYLISRFQCTYEQARFLSDYVLVLYQRASRNLKLLGYIVDEEWKTDKESLRMLRPGQLPTMSNYSTQPL